VDGLLACEVTTRLGNGGDRNGEPGAPILLLLAKRGEGLPATLGERKFSQGEPSEPGLNRFWLAADWSSSAIRRRVFAKSGSPRSSVAVGRASGSCWKHLIKSCLRAIPDISSVPFGSSTAGGPFLPLTCLKRDTGLVKPIPIQGALPVIIWTSTHPTLHTSALKLYFSSKTSGAMKYGALIKK